MLELLKDSAPIIQILFSVLLLSGLSYVCKRYVASQENTFVDIKKSIDEVRIELARNREERVKAVASAEDRIKSLEEWNAKQQGSLALGNTKFAEMNTQLYRAETKADNAQLNKVEADECDRRRDLLQQQINKQERCIDRCTETMDSVRSDVVKGLARVNGAIEILSRQLGNRIVDNPEKVGE